MEYLLVLLQGLLGIVVFTAPGMMLLLGLCRGRAPGWPVALFLAASFVISSLGVAAWQAVSVAVLSPALSRFAAWALAALLCLWLWRRGGRVAVAAVRQMGVWERRSLLALGAIATFWLLAMPLSPYPSQITMYLGDPPAYYHAAAKLVAGGGWSPDYFVADYVGGKLGYIQSHPVLVLVTSFLFQVFGVNWQSLGVYDALAGMVTVYLLASLVCSGAGRDGKHVLAITLAAALVPAHFILFGLGVVTAPSALALLTATAFVVWVPGGGVARPVAVGAALLLMFGVRPESALLALLLLVALAVRGAFVRFAPTWRRRLVGVAACALAGAALWWAGPVLAAKGPAEWKNLTVFYLRYDPATHQFAPSCEPWWMLNKRFAEAILNGGDPHAKLANPEILHTVREHPIAFAGYLLGELPRLTKLFAHALTIPQYYLPWLEGLPSLALLGALLALAWWNRGAGPVVAAVAAFVVVLPVFNGAAHVRHLLMASLVVGGLAARVAWRQWGAAACRLAARRWVGLLGGIALAVLAFLDGRSIIQLRTYGPNQTYVSILRDIELMTPARCVIASSYPQLIACMTGRHSVGSTWLAEHAELIVKRYQPDFILVDNARDGPANYSLWVRSGRRLPGYELLVHDPKEEYLILRSSARASRE